jgi:hypothetical protein
MMIAIRYLETTFHCPFYIDPQDFTFVKLLRNRNSDKLHDANISSHVSADIHEIEMPTPVRHHKVSMPNGSQKLFFECGLLRNSFYFQRVFAGMLELDSSSIGNIRISQHSNGCGQSEWKWQLLRQQIHFFYIEGIDEVNDPVGMICGPESQNSLRNGRSLIGHRQNQLSSELFWFSSDLDCRASIQISNSDRQMDQLKVSFLSKTANLYNFQLPTGRMIRVFLDSKPEQLHQMKMFVSNYLETKCGYYGHFRIWKVDDKWVAKCILDENSNHRTRSEDIVSIQLPNKVTITWKWSSETEIWDAWNDLAVLIGLPVEMLHFSVVPHSEFRELTIVAHLIPDGNCPTVTVALRPQSLHFNTAGFVYQQ